MLLKSEVPNSKSILLHSAEESKEAIQNRVRWPNGETILIDELTRSSKIIDLKLRISKLANKDP